MKITKYGHSCLRVVDGSANILIDPGTFSAGFEGLTDLTAVLITHQHPDHLDRDRLAVLLAGNPGVSVYADQATAAQLAESGVDATAVHSGDQLDAGTAVQVVGRDHAIIHVDIPVIPNVGYLIGGRLLHPGDSLAVPGQDVEILAVPASAPWMAVKEAVEFFRTVDPAVAFPIHDKVLANPAMAYGLLARLGPPTARWIDLDDGHTEEL
ncbi:MAG TPA: MBL fold metallo-hydrolase [Nakamurella sp.]|jgi:L-ascorbate metabolism protein UlaG (beta-lactamase superfamily)